MPIAERVVGAEGKTLAESWSASGMAALRGATAPGFPNWMTIIGPNTGLGNSSMILMIESQLNYMADFLRQLDVLGGRAALDARPGAVAAWNRRVQERMRRTSSRPSSPGMTQSVIMMGKSRSSKKRQASAPSAAAVKTVHDFTATPSSSTVQAPQLEESQPTCVPVRPRFSRRKCTSSCRDSTVCR
jgi:hypothetical protein